MNIEPGLVSVICCTHNRPLFVRKAIELFAAQTWSKKEMIIMDDGEAGAVPTLLPPGVQRVRIPSYTWVTHKHRLAFPLCRGEFVGYWDDDDYYGPRRLALQVQPLMDDQADATGFHVKVLASVPDAHFWKWKRSTMDRWKLGRNLADDLPFHDGTAIWRHSLLEGLDEKTLQGTQVNLLRAIRARGGRLKEIPNDDTFVYVRHSRVGWDFDVQDLCDPVDCPAWMPREMLAFWANSDLEKEGRRNG